MKVNLHPFAEKSSTLRLLFVPGVGLSVRQGSRVGEARATLPEAVEAWNKETLGALDEINAANKTKALALDCIHHDELCNFIPAIEAARDWQDAQAETASETPRGIPPIFLDGDLLRDRTLAASMGLELNAGQEMEVTVSDFRIAEEATAAPQPQFDFKRSLTVSIMGLPGSGKSLLSRMISNMLPEGHRVTIEEVQGQRKDGFKPAPQAAETVTGYPAPPAPLEGVRETFATLEAREEPPLIVEIIVRRG